MGDPVYVTVEDVRSATGSNFTARDTSQLRRAIDSASRSVEALCHRKFFPWTGTRYFAWPATPRQGPSWKVWLDANELIELTELTSDGHVIDPSEYFLEPANYGPPYSSIELNRGINSAFTAGSTGQRNIAATGTYCGTAEDWASVATLAASANSSVASITVSDSSGIGLGSLLRIGTERLQVLTKSQVTTSTTLGGNLDGNKGTTTVPVADGTKVHAGEEILVDSEVMLVVDVAGNNLLVKRAWSGSVLATHSLGATVYAPRILGVARASTGTAATAHALSDAVEVFQYPALVQELTIATVLRQQQGKVSGYADSESSKLGATLKVNPTESLKDIRQMCYDAHGRQGRIRSA